MEIEEIINELKSLDLTKYPEKEIKQFKQNRINCINGCNLS